MRLLPLCLALVVLALPATAVEPTGETAAATETPDAQAPDTGPRVRVNQLGYLPDGPKRATLVTDAESSLGFTLVDATGTTVFSSKTVPRGLDASAGVKVHSLDFSDYATAGKAYVVTVDGQTSHPFDIDPALYQTLPIDAASYYYPVRSGIEILETIAGPGYGRPAGHVGAPGDGGINKGDKAVPCQAPASSLKAYGEAWTCDYTLDVTGGWYDAGDHGKYVVNGGISVAQLMASWDRPSNRNRLGDTTLRIPEHGNGVPDILDEARWELDWMLKMQVPEGEDLAGFLHHKIHDNEWTGIPLLPHEDPKVRELHRPSTAATLNFAAVAAQGSRIFRPYDEEFADLLLRQGKIAWRVARAAKNIYAPAEDGNSGGGPYNDAELRDEYYWAAAEIYLATSDAGYLDYLRNSPHWKGDVFRPEGFDWGNVAAFARMQLALHGSALPGKDRDAIVQSVLEGADRLIDVAEDQPFGHPYAPSSGKYDWGSSHLVIQNALVLATAYDLSGEQKYRQAALEAADYIFGRNALNLSYVTGYGEHFARNQHSRWFARSVRADLPHPPNGSLSGGPNSSIQDPVAQRLFGETGCAPQTCYVDDIESWSTNEITINWNAALTQFAAWLADQ
jgi:endoglucanase